MHGHDTTPHTSVLIVGGGLTGLSMALFLAWHGVACTVVERHADVLRHPRMRSLAPRLVEMYRPMGLEPQLQRDGDRYPGHDEFTMVHADTLDAAHTVMDKNLDAAHADSSSPCRGIAIDQDRAERLVRERAAELGAKIHFGVSLVGFNDDETGVVARLRRPDGVDTVMAADYLVAADGADSAIRKRMGIGMSGPGDICRMVSVLFEADLSQVLRDRTVHMAYLNRPSPQTFLMSLDGHGGRWVLGTNDPGTAELSEADCRRLVHAAIGRPVPVRLLPPIPGASGPALRFGIGAAVAERFSESRVFLIGDAAHRMPPPGGFGGTTGVADAHNLAWKLAEVIGGRAAESLLDTYHAERHPVAEFTMRQALARSSQRLGTDWGEENEVIAERTSVMMGYRYGSGPILGARPGEVGTRFPHAWLASGRSTIDLFGSGFVLLTSIGQAFLVRPDGFVAWRSEVAVTDPGDTLARVLAELLWGGRGAVTAGAAEAIR